jgi:peptidoglycan/xylan/chitin deacetylase (PgdA/CDA1 family)
MEEAQPVSAVRPLEPVQGAVPSCRSPGMAMEREGAPVGDLAGGSSAIRRKGRADLAKAALRLLHRAGALRLAHLLWPRRLTVLAYHRITEPDDPTFKGLRANVSATPQQFAAQLDLLGRWFNVVSLDLLLEWLAGRAELPRYPALITFDDGYRDNFVHALPALRERGLPAVLFLATGCVGSGDPFFWDLAAYCFRVTRRNEAELPLCGYCSWADSSAREQVLDAWLTEAKKRPAAELGGHIAALRSALEVDVAPDTFAEQHLTWEQVEALARSGVAIEAHTHRHPILSRVPVDRARAEVLESKRCIEAALGRTVRALAYPNGREGDYRPADVDMLRREGFAAAFSLLDGPTGRHTARRQPLEIRRILVMAGDDLASFAALVTGFTRLVRTIMHLAVR